MVLAYAGGSGVSDQEATVKYMRGYFITSRWRMGSRIFFRYGQHMHRVMLKKRQGSHQHSYLVKMKGMFGGFLVLFQLYRFVFIPATFFGACLTMTSTALVAGLHFSMP